MQLQKSQKSIIYNKSLLPELNKLQDLLKVIPLTVEFVKGYIFGHLPISLRLSTFQIKQLVEVINNLYQLKNQRVFQQINFLQIIVYLSFQLFKQTQGRKINFKIILQQIDNIVCKISMNNWHLREKYFLHIFPVRNDRVNFTYINKSSLILEEKSNQMKINKQQQLNFHKKQSNQGDKMNIQSAGNLGIQCPICVVQISHRDVSVLACGHILHKNCLQQYLKEVITNKKFPIKCPFGDCTTNMDTRDIQQYLSKPLLDKYYQFSFHTFVQKNPKAVSWCPTAGCPSVFQFDQQLPNYRCPNCKKNYCLKCKCEMHIGISCELYKNLNGLSEQDKTFVDFARGLNFKQCPNCKFWVQKNQGCNHMTCRCEYEFCYKCGAQYGTCECQDDDQESYQGNYDDQQQESNYSGNEDNEQYPQPPQQE